MNLRDDFWYEKIWISPDKFSFSKREHILWLLAWLPTIRAENLNWPPSPHRSSYIEQVSTPRERLNPFKVLRKLVHKVRHPYRAKWENQRSIIANLENQLCAMGIDGLIVKSIYAYNESPEWLGKCLNLPYKVILRRAEAGLQTIIKK